MNIRVKLGGITLAVTLTTFIWFYGIVQIFVSSGPGDGTISGNNIIYLLVATAVLIIVNVVIEGISVYVWLTKAIEWYILAILLIISLFNLIFLIVELNKYI